MKMNKNQKLVTGISLNVILLGIVSFLNDVGSEMIMPILPLFVVALGGTGIIVGVIGGLRDSITSILQVFSGYWSDRIRKRKVFVFSGYLTSAFFKFLLSLSSAWQHILMFASFERVGKGLRTAPRDAIIADSMPKRRGKGFGFHRTLDTAGAVVGSILVLLLFWFLHFSFRTIIITASMISFFSLSVLYFVKDIKPAKPSEAKKTVSLITSLKKLPPRLKAFIFIASIFALSNFSYMFFLLKARELFQARGIVIFMLFYILFNVFYASFAIPFGKLSDRIGKPKVLITGYLLFSLTCFGFAFLNSLVSLIFLFALYGLSYSIVNSNQRAFVSDLTRAKTSEHDGLGTGLGTFHTMNGLMALPSSIIAGFLWNISSSTTFMYGGIMSIIAVSSFAILWKKF